ncbi:MAG: preprotein translocase subunit SecA [Thiotrichales bacterium]|mgnify:CR=1 FL=1|jgi:preprotein translocase subunit SecA|nr:preprotein translocase subunit SecA [Thiotrichales bacterium]MBT3614196.1 preprotein translocase subunit SecA [Thiotrichales bacterium]MBT3752014.1 preprotein translocase subunit SecA [Thiotrichales bacterium]MBT3837397.1 preprotein translocase subunit SecA [Thiotrichales bacterium]MBT4152682.1 preprotein translocase subunit SecA [Thiotrichales bacterium]
MIKKVFKKIFGSRNERTIRGLRKVVGSINAMEEKLQQLSDDELRDKSTEFRNRIENGETLDQLLPEAFAVVREGSQRVFKMRHYDEQMIGGMVLHQGKISEMRTGEGKTLMATLAVYLNALSGKGVHVVTVNDYLASRDANWMGKLYNFLGMSVGVILSGLEHEERKAAYAADITYGTNNEFGFDYLRDNMAFSAPERVQRGSNYAVVDEVDSILIDEARTPLIISGPTDDNSELYHTMNSLPAQLTKRTEEFDPKGDEEIGDVAGDYTVDEKQRQVLLTEVGYEKVEALLTEAGLLEDGESLYEPQNITLMHHLYAALRAHVLFIKNDHYIIQDGQIVIVDEFTGRTMPGRRWGEGLHQAVEAKEGVTIQNENQTMASITFQNYFRMYDSLAGMTGTADTEAFEFQQIYGLEVVVIPTHREMVRKDMADLVFLTAPEKFKAIVEDVQDCLERKQPVLVGTASIENSELVSDLLKEAGVQHEVLNAKQHEREAHIIENAGVPGAVTIATNMAGRGTDIVLGGSLDAKIKELGEEPAEDKVEELRAEWEELHKRVLQSGGLHIIGTERHESRRIDNQLRGRSGRQGDAGSSRFYLSLEDSLMRIFASERLAGMMQKLGMEDGEAIEHKWVNRAIENAQRKVEGHNFDTRKQLLEYDDVANDQRQVIYEQRNELMDVDDISETVQAIREDVINQLIDQFVPPQSMDEQWDIPGLEEELKQQFLLEFDIQQWLKEDDSLHEETLRERVVAEMESVYTEKESLAGFETVRHFEKAVMLQVLDHQWKEHLQAMDHLRQGIHLRGYAQKNPKQEYKRESFEMFSALLDKMKQDALGAMTRVEVRSEEDVAAVEEKRRKIEGMEFKHAPAAMANTAPSAEELNSQDEGAESEQPFVRGDKVGRNEPCPCGSGKKYKKCHGKLS